MFEWVVNGDVIAFACYVEKHVKRDKIPYPGLTKLTQEIDNVA